MFKKILIAIDNSATSQAVFTQALSLAQQNQASLMLLHVLSGDEENSPTWIPTHMDSAYWETGAETDLDNWRKQWENYEQEGLVKLRQLIAEAHQAGIDAEFRQIAGSPGRNICHLAWSWQADLIVVGNRGHSGVKELFLGSVSNYVLHHAPCSVLTLKAAV
ncbi:universal stress protein [Pleurocapsales cyanobacterium LEGE 10410]|nr:universal stress protein [Pleurocapsales cyanobacterium LEGE 10410]